MRSPLRYPRRSPAIDLLRGLSILWVMLLHSRIGGAEYSALAVIPASILNPIAYNGVLGVSVFFVISGYLITGMALRRDGGFDRIRIGHFYRFRASRILPPLGVLLAINLDVACGLLHAWVHEPLQRWLRRFPGHRCGTPTADALGTIG